MVQDMGSHLKYYFNEQNQVLKDRFYKRVIYIELEKIIKGVLLNCGVFPEGIGGFLYDNLKQDIFLKIHEAITPETIEHISNVNGYIFAFGKNYCLNELKRNNKLEWIKNVLNEQK